MVDDVWWWMMNAPKIPQLISSVFLWRHLQQPQVIFEIQGTSSSAMDVAFARLGSWFVVEGQGHNTKKKYPL